MAASSEKNKTELAIRKYRKKLRQIENLECLDRELTTDERDKISKKSTLRAELRCLLAEYGLTNDASVHSVSDDSYTTAYTDVSTTGGDDTRCHFREQQEANEPSGNGESIDNEELALSVFQSSGEEGCADLQSPYVDDNLAGGDKENTGSEELSPSKRVEPSDEKQPADVPVKKKKVEQTRKKHSETDAERLAREKRKVWRTKTFQKTYLDGHNDLICCVATDGKMAVSGSRDTTVKLWDLESGREVKNFGGHTGAVTCCQLLSPHQSKNIGRDLVDDGDQIIISASTDCSVKLWSCATGKLLKSIYTYSPVTCLQVLDSQGYILTGSEGGKLELWRPLSGDNALSLLIHDESISAVQACQKYVTTSCVNGIVKVFEWRGEQLHLMFESENVRSASTGAQLPCRRICCMAAYNEVIYYGDDGVNIKVLEWKKGLVSKLKNHSCEFGATDALCILDDVLLSSGLDVDSGCGYLNFHSVPDNQYLSCLCDDDVTRILTVAGGYNGDHQGLRIVTGGADLILWSETSSDNFSEECAYSRTMYSAIYDQTAVDSDVSASETEVSDDEQHGDSSDQLQRGVLSLQGGENSGWTSWCSLI